MRKQALAEPLHTQGSCGATRPLNDGQKFASIAHYNLFGRGSWSRVATDTIVEDALAARRFKGLLDYVEALVKLDERVATRLAQHKLADGSQFILHQRIHRTRRGLLWLLRSGRTHLVAHSKTATDESAALRRAW